MKFLTKPMGRFPLGIWIVLVFLLISGLLFTIVGQALSVLSWDTALSLGLQKDSPHSIDVVERMMMAISWGEAGTDVLVQGVLIVLNLDGYPTTASDWLSCWRRASDYLDLRHAFDHTSAGCLVSLGVGD